MTDRLVLRELSRYQLGTFADIIYRNAILYPDNEAFVYGAERISFGRFNERVNCLIHGLQDMGLKKGDVIGILSWNHLEYCDVFGAAMKGGLVLAHFNPRLKAEELIHVINDSEAKVVFFGADFVETIGDIRGRIPKAEAYVTFGDVSDGITGHKELMDSGSKEEPDCDVGEDDPVVIFYTSGTTGLPRGAIYTHKQKLENAIIKALDIGLEFGDRHLVVLPMFHIGGDSHIWPFFVTGGCNVIMDRVSFDPEAALKIILDEKITDVHIVPTQLVSLLNLPGIEKYDLPNLKRIWYAASPMPVEVLKQGLKTFGPVFLQGYGQTESGPHSTMLKKVIHRQAIDSPDDQGVLASCGQPCIGVHMRVVDDSNNDVGIGEVGEIIIKSRRIMTEYWHKPEDTKETIRDGWLYTGDMAYYDEKGFIYIADRKKDMIVTGGENVFPKEVEEVLYRHPAVREAAVIGIPDPYWVEKVYAVIVLKAEGQATEEEIIKFCREYMANYKTPKGVEFVQSLPKNPQGKILKKDLRAKYWK
ncbi:MAG: class I adenylate-forming enzyme family protein [Desulfatiglandales bacterium]